MLQLSDFNPILSDLDKHAGNPVRIKSFAKKAGGSVNHSFDIDTTAGKFFLKSNIPGKYMGMYDAEAKGLVILKDKTSLKVPAVISHGTTEKFDYLLMEYLDQGQRLTNSMGILAKGVAELHRNTNEKFGLEQNNFIATLSQDNGNESRWDDFFIFRRIEPLARLAIDSGRINPSISKRISKLYQLINEIYPQEKPSLVHGDLWSGNYMVTQSGEVSIFDPAVYYGHREMDIAMTKLFGGFTQEFYEEYNRAYPLEKDWESRIRISNLYPLFVHLNLFGESYRKEIEQTLELF